MVCHVCVVGASVFKCSKSLRLFHVYSAALNLKEFFFFPECAHAWLCVFVPPPCFSLICTRRKNLKVQTHSVPGRLFWGNITTGISHSSKESLIILGSAVF